MSETITPKKGLGKQKVGEIYRLQLLMSELDLKPENIQSDTGVAARTITHSLYEGKPLGNKLLRALHEKYGVSVDWLLFGVGTMFVQKTGEIYDPAAGSGGLIQDFKMKRVITFLHEWATYADEDEKTWLEMQIKMNLPAYKQYLENN